MHLDLNLLAYFLFNGMIYDYLVIITWWSCASLALKRAQVQVQVRL